MFAVPQKSLANTKPPANNFLRVTSKGSYSGAIKNRTAYQDVISRDRELETVAVLSNN